jgi:GDP-L-fucose synthase
MNILVTGGAGFLGQHLKHYLEATHTVIAPNKFQLNCLDATSVNNFFDKNAIDVVIHTALTGRENLFSTDPKFLIDGLDMWRNIYNNRHKFKKLIQFGSAYELDLNKNNTLITANNVLKDLPLPSYGYCKNIMSRMCLQTENFYNLRLFGNFHYTEKENRFFKKLLNSSSFTIAENRLFDYVNLDDVLKVAEFVINESPTVKDINVVYPDKLTLSEQASMFCSLNNINTEITVANKGFDLTGNSDVLQSFNLKLDGLEAGFKKYTKG